MEMIEIGAAEKEQIRKFYEVTETSIKEDVERIKTWMSKQPHLPQDVTDDFIEKILLRNKFRVERTKQKLDNYYSLRGANRDLIQNFENIVPSQETVTYIPLPKVTHNFERIIIIKLSNFDPDRYDVHRFISTHLAIEELTIHYDYSIGLRYFIDLEGFSLNHFLKVNPIPLIKMVNMIEQAYSNRILGMEMMNGPAIFSKLLGLLKIILKPKIYNRVRIHKDLESMHQVIPKQYLPEEYGGTLAPIPELLKMLDKVMIAHKEFYLKNYQNVSQEHLRLSESKFSDSFGISGTFKHLQLD